MTTSIHGSNVHEAFALMATLLAPRVSMRYLNLCKKLLQRRQMEEVFEERAAAKRCAFPGCVQLLSTCVAYFYRIIGRYVNFYPIILPDSILSCLDYTEQHERQVSGLVGSPRDL